MYFPERIWGFFSTVGLFWYWGICDSLAYILYSISRRIYSQTSTLSVEYIKIIVSNFTYQKCMWFILRFHLPKSAFCFWITQVIFFCTFIDQILAFYFNKDSGSREWNLKTGIIKTFLSVGAHFTKGNVQKGPSLFFRVFQTYLPTLSGVLLDLKSWKSYFFRTLFLKKGRPLWRFPKVTKTNM